MNAEMYFLIIICTDIINLTQKSTRCEKNLMLRYFLDDEIK